MKLIIGLGNPGNKYEKTRHNIGFRIIDAFREMHEFEQVSIGKKYNTEAAEGKLGRENILLVKPQTFMNFSGKTVANLINFYKLNPQKDILICFDDKDIPFGTIREKKKGSAGGHKGIKSIIEAIGSSEFNRLKFGIGHEDQGIPTDAFVLQKFSEEEEEELLVLIDEAVIKIEKWLK